MGKLIDLVDREFGILTVTSRSKKKVGSKLYWWCKCDCGNMKEIAGCDMRQGDTKSCGCATGKWTSERQLKHGDQPAKTMPEYRSWQNMKARCKYENRKGYKDYGGRGICVCGRWKDSFESFRADMGPMPITPEIPYSVERENTNGNYSCGKCPECVANGWPMNCHW